MIGVEVLAFVALSVLEADAANKTGHEGGNKYPEDGIDFEIQFFVVEDI